LRSLFVLDTHALLAYLEDEEGADLVAASIKDAVDGKIDLAFSLVNWGELYYITLRAHGREKLRRALADVETLPIKIEPIDIDLTRRAAEIKASHRLSYADAFAAALARSKGATLLTGDDEFAALADQIKIRWIRGKRRTQ